VNVNTDTDFSNPFNNSAAGSVLVHAGTLALSGGGTSNGSFSADAGATLSIASNYILQTGASETGSGTLLIDSGMLTAGADVSVQNLILAGGTLTGAGTVTVSGLMTWTGGSMAGTGVTNVARGGFLNINGGSTYTGLRTINNEGMNISVNPSNVFVSTDSTFTQLESFVASGLQTLANDLGLPYGNLIPLLGHALNTIPGSLINEVTPGLPKTIKGISLSAIQQDLFQVFGPPGLDILRLNGSAPEFIPILNSDGMVAITLPIGRSFTVQAPFDLGLPGLPLKLNASGSVQGSVDVNLNLNFSVAQLAGQSPSFQIEPSFIQAEVMASVPGLMASARAGLLQAEATDDPKHPSSLLLIYLTNFATDPSGGLMVSTTTNGSATVNLLLSASFGSDPVNDPTITSNFNLDWSFSNADPAQSSPFGNTPNIAFNNVQLHLGSFVGDFLAPVLSDVQVLTRRLDPLAKFLLQEVPVISDLSRDVGSGPIYLANLIPEYGETIVRFAMAVEVINGLDSNALRTGVVSLGNFTVTDPRATDSAGDAPPAGILQDNAAPDVIAQISGLSPDAANFFDQLSMLGSSDTLHFTILDDPTNAFDLLIGRDTTLFSYTVTPLMISDTVFTYDIPVYPGVVVHFQGDLNFSVSATFGCDSSGLHGGNILDSFYLQNVSIMVGFTVEAGPGVGIPDLFTVSVDGGLGVSATFTLTGTDGNPRLTWSELADGQYTVSDSGDVQGSLSIDVTSLGMDLYSFTLASFDRHIF